ncbi:MAG: GntR family transcriptional regulator [Phycisphaeraceae bacterium]
MALEFHISPGGSVPIYRQITDQINHAVLAGHLQSGDALPSVRALAETLVINPNTVARAYGELVRDGVLESQQGKAVTVAPRRQKYTKAERLRRLEPALQAFVSAALLLGFTPAEIGAMVERRLAEFASRTPGKGDGRD